jgi:hypothetical protein
VRRLLALLGWAFRNREPEAAAVMRIYAALAPLARAQRRRVIAVAYERFITDNDDAPHTVEVRIPVETFDRLARGWAH